MTNCRRFLFASLLVSVAACDAPAPSELDASIRALLSGPLAAGDVQSFSGASAALITVDGGLEGADYLFVVSNTSTAGGGFAEITVAGDGMTSDQADPSPGREQSVVGLDGAALSHLPHEDGGFHRWHRERETRLVRELVGSLPQGARSLLLEAAPATQAVPDVDDIIQINVNAGSACASPDWQDARVEAVSDQAIVLADLRNPAGLTRSDFERIAQDFDEKVYPLSTENFGAPARQIGPDRATILYTVAVNELASEFGGLIGGFFFARDLFPATAQAGFETCPASNEREMFYMLTADPDGAHGDPITVEFVRDRTLNTVMHEHQHLVNASRRLYIVNTGNLETVWLNEALSHIGEEVLFYQESGLAPRQNITLQTVRATQARLDAVNAYQVQNLVRYLLYLSDPPAESPIAPEDGLEMRGAAWSFLRYLTDQYADGADSQFFRDLVNTSETGIGNLEARIGRSVEGPLYWWDVSNYADDLVSNLDGVYRQQSWNFRSMLPALTENEQFPLTAETLRSGDIIDVSVRGGSAHFIRFSVPPGSRATLTTWSGGNTPPQTVRATVVRIR